MADFIDLEDDSVAPEKVEAQQQEPVQQEAPKEPEVQLPDKYKGKSLEDIVKMHQEAEKLIGKHAQEVGEVRKLADELIKQQLNTKKPEKQEVEREVDFFDDPKAAVRQEIQNDPLIQEFKQQTAQMRQQQTVQRLQEKHPDFKEITNNPDFVEWVKGSNIRLMMAAQADNYDFDAADELLSTFKAVKGIKEQKATEADKQLVEENQQARSKALSSASVDAGGTGASVKKTYRRADLIRLRMQDPDRYMMMSDEIQAAYAEGRVK
jgi:hypothetical protein